jgi:hypothetical protein
MVHIEVNLAPKPMDLGTVWVILLNGNTLT